MFDKSNETQILDLKFLAKILIAFQVSIFI